MNRPILLENVFKTDRWGGNNLQKLFGFDSPYVKTSEVWTASAHYKGETCATIVNETMPEVIKLSDFYMQDKAKRFFGQNCLKYGKFPLLAKWIDANDSLSVQVHPDDYYAKQMHENSYGKSEAWYIVSAKPNAQIIYGLKPGTTKQDLKKAIAENRITDVLNFIPVKKGEVYYIPAGMVHALLDGVVVYEIQQSSDITYRLYDWNRDDETRPLSVEKSLSVIKYSNNDEYINTYKYSNFECLQTPYFNFYTKKINGDEMIITDRTSFKLCTVLEGAVYIKGWEGSFIERIKAGNSFILPTPTNPLNIMSVYSISGKATIFISTVK